MLPPVELPELLDVLVPELVELAVLPAEAVPLEVVPVELAAPDELLTPLDPLPAEVTPAEELANEVVPAVEELELAEFEVDVEAFGCDPTQPDAKTTTTASHRRT